MPHLGGYQKLARLAGARGRIVDGRADLLLQEVIFGFGLLAFLASVFVSTESLRASELSFWYATLGLFLAVPAYFLSDKPRFCRALITLVLLANLAIATIAWHPNNYQDALLPMILFCVVVLLITGRQLVQLRANSLAR
ncbi:MAG: hypothetical protein AAF270_12930 [Pseudomonadota bacterium]